MSRSSTAPAHALALTAALTTAATAFAQGGGPVPTFGPDIHCVFVVENAVPPVPPQARMPFPIPSARDAYQLLVQRDRLTVSVLRFPAFDIKTAPRKEILIQEQGERRTMLSWDTNSPSIDVRDRATGGMRFKLFVNGHGRPGSNERSAIASLFRAPTRSVTCRLFPEGSVGPL